MNVFIPLFLLSFIADAAVLRWDDVKRMALEQNPTLRSSEKTYLASKKSVNQSYGSFLPSLSLSARKSTSEALSAAVETESRSEILTGTANLNLFSGFSSLANVKKNIASRGESEANLEIASIDLRNSLKRVFSTAYIQQERIKLFARTLKRQEQNEKLVSLKYNSGAEARWNLLKAKADKERAQFNLSMAGRELENSQAELGRLLNLPVPPKQVVEISLKEIEKEMPLPASLESHPVWRKALFTEDKVSQDSLAARAAFYPSLDLSYSKSKEKSRPGTEREVDSISLSASWNIFNGLSDFYNVQRANLNIESVVLQNAEVKSSLETTARVSRVKAINSVSRLPSARALRGAAEERLKTVSTQYRAGLKSYLDWEQAENQLLESETAEINALGEALLALADLEKAFGIPLGAP